MSEALVALSAADVYAMPSLYEGFSISALEAFSVGLPVILSNVPGLIDFQAFFPGVLYVQATPEALAEALIASTRMTQGERKAHSLKYRQIVLKYFNAEHGVQEYCTIYRETVRHA